MLFHALASFRLPVAFRAAADHRLSIGQGLQAA
jgi:hypothetical protein